MVTRAARPGPPGDPAGEYEHLQLTTLAGWHGFVTEMPAVPDLLPEAIWTGLEPANAPATTMTASTTTPGCWWSRPP
jgi:hypothetical protein